MFTARQCHNRYNYRYQFCWRKRNQYHQKKNNNQKIIMACCPPGSLPALTPPSQYTPKGSILTFPRRDTDTSEGACKVNCYCVGSQSKAKAAVIICTDIWGINGGRTKSIADQLASDPYYYVIVADLFGNEDNADMHGGPGSASFNDWIVKYTPARVTADIATITHGITSMTSKEGHTQITKFGIIGFCWGAYVVFNVCHSSFDFSSSFKCGIGVHPSLQRTETFGTSAVELAQDIAIPQLFLPAGNDNDNVKPGGEVIQQLLNNNKKKGEEVGHSSYCFEKMRHGWVTRGDLSDEEVVSDVKLAMNMIQDFLDKHMK